MNADVKQVSEESQDNAGVMSEEEIDENLEETFPASDPSAWTVGTAHRSSLDQEREDERDSKR